MARQVASLFGVLRLDDSDYKTKLTSAVQQTNSLGQTLQNQGQQLQQFGQGMTTFFAPVGAAMGYALVQGHTFDRTFSNINAILQMGTEDAANLRRQILAFGSNTVAGPQATAEAYYEIVSGVTDASTHMAILEQATRTAEAGQADLGATTSAMISIMNAYGFAANDAALVSDVLSRTVGMGVGSMNEFAAAFPNVTGLASEYGVSLESLGGAMAYLTTQGNTAGVASTYLRSMVTTLLSPTADLAEVINSLGYESGAALLEAEGLFGAYAAISEVNGGFAGLITNTEALAGATALVNEEGGAFLYTYTQGLEGATASSGAIQDQTESWALLKSQLEGVAIQISDALMPTLNNLVVNYISPAVTAVSGWIAENPELTTQIALITGGLVILGPIIAGVGMFMSGLGTVIGLASAAAGGLTIAVGILASPFVALGLIIAGIIWMINQPGGLIGTLHRAAQNATTLVDQLETIVRLSSTQLYDLPQQINNAATGQTQRLGGGGQASAPQNADGSGYVRGGMPVEWQEPKSGGEIFIPRVTGSILNAQQQFAAGMASGMSLNAGRNQGGDTWNVNVYANSEEEGAAAADGFERRVVELKRMRGVTG